MSTPDTTEPKSTDFQAEVFNKTLRSWDNIGTIAHDLVVDTFGEAFDGALPGGTDDVVAYPSLKEAFMSPDTSAVVLNDSSGDFAGFTLSVPIGKMYPERSQESEETSYIYFTVLKENFRGQKLVGRMTDFLFEDLAKRGYKFVERDSMLENGYADSISRHYDASIVESYDHERFPEVGPERFFRIDINKYLTSQGLTAIYQ